LVLRERDRLAAELKDHQKRLQTNRLYSESVEVMIEVYKEIISKLNARAKKAELDNFRLEHRCNVEQDKYEDRLLHLNKELVAVVQQNEELQAAEKDFMELAATNEALKQRSDRLSRENHTLTKSLRIMEDEKNKLQTSLKVSEGLNDAQRRDKLDLELARRSAERDAKKKADDSMILERRFHLLAKKNTELNDQVLVNQ